MLVCGIAERVRRRRRRRLWYAVYGSVRVCFCIQVQVHIAVWDVCEYWRGILTHYVCEFTILLRNKYMQNRRRRRIYMQNEREYT